MQHQLFENYTPEERLQMLSDNADSVQKDTFLKRFTATERNQCRKRNADIDMLLNDIKAEEEDFRREIKERKDPLLGEKKKLLESIKMDGRYVEGRLFKFVDEEAKMVGFYDEDGMLVSSRRINDEDRQRTLRLRTTGTED